MAGPNLPLNVDTTYSDSGTDPTVKAHQQHHDALHKFANRYDVDAAPVQGQVPVFDGNSGLYKPSELTDTPLIVSAATQGTGAYPARPATGRPVVWRGVTQPGTDGSTAGGGGMVLGLDEWDPWSGTDPGGSGAVQLTGNQSKAGVLTLKDGLVVPNGGAVSIPDGSLTQADIAGLVTRLNAIETALANKADSINAIAAYVKAGDPIPAGLPVGSIVALEVTAGTTGVADPAFVGYAPVSGTSATLTMALPTGSAAGHLIVVPHMHSPGLKADGTTINDPYTYSPPGTTGVASNTLNSTNRFEVTYKVLTAADITAGSVSITFAGPQKPTGAALVIANAGVPTGSIVVTASSATATPPPITTTKRALIFTFIAKRVTGATFTGSTQPSGETMVGSPTSNGTSTGGETALATAQFPTVQAAGTITPTGWTLNAAAAVFAATIAIPATA